MICLNYMIYCRQKLLQKFIIINKYENKLNSTESENEMPESWLTLVNKCIIEILDHIWKE